MLTLVEAAGADVLKFNGVGTGEFGIVIVAGTVTNWGLFVVKLTVTGALALLTSNN